MLNHRHCTDDTSSELHADGLSPDGRRYSWKYNHIYWL